ncbi:MAG: cell wall hydrolase [Pseudomonadota bacterium]|nr:cell wall hydrolase [Sphingomonas sp.]MDQ3477902.1 cell wall hydrolase [Pseudomonadota bacterium]
MSASSVALAQVGPTVEPLIPADSPMIASIVVPQPISPTIEPIATPDETPASDPALVEEAETPKAPAAVLNRNADLVSLVAELRGAETGSRELECLAAGIYFESKSEPLTGQLAVGQVIANRASSGRFAKTYCGVLFQRGQFSFVRGGRWPAVAKGRRQWQNAVAVAKIVDRGLKDSSVGKALFFHAKRVNPRWRLRRVASVGNHIFYR